MNEYYNNHNISLCLDVAYNLVETNTKYPYQYEKNYAISTDDYSTVMCYYDIYINCVYQPKTTYNNINNNLGSNKNRTNHIRYEKIYNECYVIMKKGKLLHNIGNFNKGDRVVMIIIVTTTYVDIILKYNNHKLNKSITNNIFRFKIYRDYTFDNDASDKSIYNINYISILSKHEYILFTDYIHQKYHYVHDLITDYNYQFNY